MGASSPFFDPSRAEREHVLFAGLSGPLTLQDERDKMVAVTPVGEKLELKNLKEKIITDKQTQHCSDAELVFFLSRAAGNQPAAHASESSWATPPDLTLQIMIRAANPSQAPKVRDVLYLWGFSTTGLFLVRRDF